MNYLTVGFRLMARGLQAVAHSLRFVYTGRLPDSDLHHFSKRQANWHGYLYGKGKYGDKK